MSDYERAVAEAAQYVGSNTRLRPRVAIVLGSGLAAVATALTQADDISYEAIPHFPRTSVDGHRGRLLIGDLRGVPAIAFQGRVHAYEGKSMRDVAFPVYVAKQLGVEVLVVTNAAGAVNHHFAPGDVVLVTDHLNLAGANPLTGPNLEAGPRFVDLRDAYDLALRDAAKRAAAARNIELHEGVYAMMAGPAYETSAEVRMLRTLGADAVGMSTVPEVIAARHAGMRVLGLSVIANRASDADAAPLTHEEVLRTVESAAHRVRGVIEGVVETLRV